MCTPDTLFDDPMRMSSEETPEYLFRLAVALSRVSCTLTLSLRSCEGERLRQLPGTNAGLAFGESKSRAPRP